MPKKETIELLLKFDQSILSDAEIILAHVLDKSKSYILSHKNDVITHQQSAIFKKLIDRRISGEPIAYIIGKKEFYGRDFTVNSTVLVPRPETELLVDCALDSLQKYHDTKTKKPIIVVDVGTGSGAIITTIASELKKQFPDHSCGFIATDISKEALVVAHKNALTHTIADHISFINVDLLTPFLTNAPLQRMLKMGAHLLICANLPYVDSAKKEMLLARPESCGLAFEPDDALWANDGGLALYKQFFAQLKKIHKDAPITILCEIDPEQENAFIILIHKDFQKVQIKTHPDLSGRVRVVEIILN